MPLFKELLKPSLLTPQSQRQPMRNRNSRWAPEYDDYPGPPRRYLPRPLDPQALLSPVPASRDTRLSTAVARPSTPASTELQKPSFVLEGGYIRSSMAQGGIDTSANWADEVERVIKEAGHQSREQNLLEVEKAVGKLRVTKSGEERDGEGEDRDEDEDDEDDDGEEEHWEEDEQHSSERQDEKEYGCCFMGPTDEKLLETLEREILERKIAAQEKELAGQMKEVDRRLKVIRDQKEKKMERIMEWLMNVEDK